MADDDRTRLSTSVQMYLAAIARLGEESEPVPLSHLAEALSISGASVNEMCRKLQDRGWVVYRPYEGASLTDEGRREALRVLRRHRLWEVFLVEKLGLAYAEAHDLACSLEHVSPTTLTERLAHYLGHPVVNPAGDPIPPPAGEGSLVRAVPLSQATVGWRCHVLRCGGAAPACAYLREQGLRPGAVLEVLAAGPDSMLIRAGAALVSLQRSLAEDVQVEPPAEEA